MATAPIEVEGQLSVSGVQDGLVAVALVVFQTPPLADAGIDRVRVGRISGKASTAR